MKIDISDIRYCDGASKSFEIGGSLDGFSKPLRIVGKIANIGGAIELRSTIEGTYTSECARCGESVDTPITAQLDEDIGEEYDEESFALSDKVLDISGAVAGCVYEQMPLRVLCREDCKGLCPKCGANLNNTKCNCDTTDYDPRFAIFRNLSQGSDL